MEEFSTPALSLLRDNAGVHENKMIKQFSERCSVVVRSLAVNLRSSVSYMTAEGTHNIVFISTVNSRRLGYRQCLTVLYLPLHYIVQHSTLAQCYTARGYNHKSTQSGPAVVKQL